MEAAWCWDCFRTPWLLGMLLWPKVKRWVAVGFSVSLFSSAFSSVCLLSLFPVLPSSFFFFCSSSLSSRPNPRRLSLLLRLLYVAIVGCTVYFDPDFLLRFHFFFLHMAKRNDGMSYVFSQDSAPPYTFYWRCIYIDLRMIAVGGRRWDNAHLMVALLA